MDLFGELVRRQSEFVIPNPPTLSPEGVSEIMKRQGQRPEPKPEPVPPEIEQQLVAHVGWSKLHNNYKVQFGNYKYFTHEFDDAVRHAWRIACKVVVEPGAVLGSLGISE
jgi:hypothetical protein